MSSAILGLPSVPPELKAITPYLQRAEELKKQDPIIAYWCAYYAAQVGIALKARDSQSRDLLYALLGTLEQMKAAIGHKDALDVEIVSSAYVENFALKVFANADNEDRSGRTTRSTAKKFLAAANFLEVLKTFTQVDITESNEEKIRYAKWKAADIAKAFREGRKPVRGPPGWAEEQEELKRQQEGTEQFTIPSPPMLPLAHSSDSALVSSSPRIYKPGTSPPRSSYASSTSTVSPPSSSLPNFDHQAMVDQPRGRWAEHGDLASGTWSTTATPGTEVADVFSMDAPSPSRTAFDGPMNVGRTKPRSGSGSSSNTIGSNGSIKGVLKKTDGLEGKHSPSSSPSKSSVKSRSPDSDKKVHFTPSTAGSPPPPSPSQLKSSPPKEYIGPSSIYAPLPPTVVSPTHTTQVYPSSGVPPSIPPPSLSPPRSYIYSSPPPARNSPPRSTGIYAHPIAPPPIPKEPFELTPSIIAKAQRHCRFAISSLDYEDAEQARKELRAALALLGD
ncbi:unnamed protein product [Cyclocybe aegerita]|uniref:DUF605-domain-containing protein n=1 Tax=Cyclocybe aegerita TaxID=1973307 RepID=A0A8S0XU39_CYCAE|nr:unnamed protein product [Cyclocybe aegerita]